MPSTDNSYTGPDTRRGTLGCFARCRVSCQIVCIEVCVVDGRIQDYWFSFVRSFDEVEEQPQKNAKLWAYIYQTLAAAVAAVVILFVIFTFCLRGVGVQGASMEPTLHEGDLLAVASLSDIKSKDVVIITQPNEMDKPLVKRVIATGGQEVNIDYVSGVITVNGEVLDEPYIAEPTSAQGDVQFPMTVPEGSFFVLGDNRNNSMDSRFSVIGCIDEDYILGVVKFRVFPFSAIEIIG